MAKRLKFKAVFTNKISSEKALPRHIGGKVENIFGIAFCRKFLFPRQKALFKKVSSTARLPVSPSTE